MLGKVWFALTTEVVIFGVLLFASAGTLRWPQAWVFLVLFFAATAWLVLRVAHDDPALLAERMKAPIQKNQPLWDKILLPSILVAWCAWMALMGLDAVRFRWSVVPLWLQCVGGVLFVGCYWLFDRIYKANPFLFPVVKIQSEKGHRVVSGGPYAIVRHPLYAAVFIFLPANALLLGSWYGVATSLFFCGVLVFRTVMEERELLRGLEGYAEYAQRVRWRLIPCVW